MLMSNTLFRMGGAAVLLTNKPREAGRSKYRLLHTIRTHRGADNDSYSSVFQDIDENQEKVGVRLSKNLMKVAGEVRSITHAHPHSYTAGGKIAHILLIHRLCVEISQVWAL